MGFSSWNCMACGNSLRAPSTSQPWMRRAVVIPKTGDVVEGVYDGYGRVTRLAMTAAELEKWEPDQFEGWEVDIYELEPFTLYHQACWKILGEPLDYDGEAPHAQDQGHFTDYDPPEPHTAADLAELVAAGYEGAEGPGSEQLQTALREYIKERAYGIKYDHDPDDPLPDEDAIEYAIEFMWKELDGPFAVPVRELVSHHVYPAEVEDHTHQELRSALSVIELEDHAKWDLEAGRLDGLGALRGDVLRPEFPSWERADTQDLLVALDDTLADLTEAAQYQASIDDRDFGPPGSRTELPWDDAFREADREMQDNLDGEWSVSDLIAGNNLPPEARGYTLVELRRLVALVSSHEDERVR